MSILNAPPSDFDQKAFAQQARLIYTQKYKDSFEKKYKGKYAAIHVNSGEAFIGDTRTQSYYEAIKNIPTNFSFL